MKGKPSTAVIMMFVLVLGVGGIAASSSHGAEKPRSIGDEVDVTIIPRDLTLYDIHRQPTERLRTLPSGERERIYEFVYPDEGDVFVDVQVDFICSGSSSLTLSLDQVVLKGSDGEGVYPAQRWLKIEDRLLQYTTESLELSGKTMIGVMFEVPADDWRDLVMHVGSEPVARLGELPDRDTRPLGAVR
jgi:hypothetical protein